MLSAIYKHNIPIYKSHRVFYFYSLLHCVDIVPDLVKVCHPSLNALSSSSSSSSLQACQLPLFSYIVERLCACCYEQAWFAKLGGVVSIKFLMERLPLIWVLQNQLTFLKALLFVMMDLTGEVRPRGLVFCFVLLWFLWFIWQNCSFFCIVRQMNLSGGHLVNNVT